VAIADGRKQKHPRSISVINYKGGVGKTTVTYLLGFYLALETARKVLLIDIDAQCSLTLAAGIDPERATLSKNIYDIVKPDSWGRIRELQLSEYISAIPRLAAPLYIIPGGFLVENLDIEIVEAIYSQRQRSKDELFLYCRQLLNSLDDYQYILIDCPPNKMYLTQAMLRASQHFVAVTIPDRVSIYGMPRLMRWIREIDDGERPKFLGYVLNAVNRTGGSPLGKVISQQAAERELRSNFSNLLTRYEMAIMGNDPNLGNIPRLDAIARFLGEEKSVQLDFKRRTSGQPAVDSCLKLITKNVVGRIQSYNA
jgi:chromosome partitioning protein